MPVETSPTHDPTPHAIGPLDAVLLSLGRHPGDLDPAGRSLIGQVPLALSTASAAR